MNHKTSFLYFIVCFLVACSYPTDKNLIYGVYSIRGNPSEHSLKIYSNETYEHEFMYENEAVLYKGTWEEIDGQSEEIRIGIYTFDFIATNNKRHYPNPLKLRKTKKDWYPVLEKGNLLSEFIISFRPREPRGNSTDAISLRYIGRGRSRMVGFSLKALMLKVI